MADIIIVISDLHLGSGSLDDFDREIEGHLADFLTELSTKEESVELVINGDFIDFVQASPWKEKKLRGKSKDGINLCFTEKQSLSKLEGVYKGHKLTFKKLRKFLSSKRENKLTILPGNHDVDFFWPRVRKLFKKKVSQKKPYLEGQIKFHLEQAYYPDGLPSIRIEHGHQYDPINSFFINKSPYWSAFNPPIFKDHNNELRLYECIGTRFLNKYINYLDECYPFIDNVKPFSKFLNIFWRSAFHSEYGSAKACVAIWGMMKYLGSTSINTPTDLMCQESLNSPNPLHTIIAMLDKLSDEEKKIFYEKLNNRNMISLRLTKPLDHIEANSSEETLILKFLSKNLDILDNLELDNYSTLSLQGENKNGTLALRRGFQINETEELKKASERIFEQDRTEIIIMGHTHEVVSTNAKFKYFNTGCWTRHYNFYEIENPQTWSILKSASHTFFPYKLNYVKINKKPQILVVFITYKEKLND